MTWKILITDYVWPNNDIERCILETAGADVIIAPDNTEETLTKLVCDCDAILTCFAKITDKVIRAATKCVVIGRFGVGVDNIDVKTASELGIAVTYVPDYCVNEVSDHVVAMMLTWNRKIAVFNNSVKKHGWDSLPLNMRIMRLTDKKLGIIGFGRIGKAVADKALSFGLHILVYDPNIPEYQSDSEKIRQVSLEELLATSDFITLHTPATNETKNLIDKRELNKMKKDSFLINCSRGSLINESALYDALKNEDIGGAGIDVMVDPIPSRNHPFFKLDNIIITPHTAFFSQESTEELQKRASTEVVSVMNGIMPENLFNEEVLNHPNPRHSIK